jgi:DNA-directed RNA polymerase subunit RPC12/RpoP
MMLMIYCMKCEKVVVPVRDKDRDRSRCPTCWSYLLRPANEDPSFA